MKSSLKHTIRRLLFAPLLACVAVLPSLAQTQAATPSDAKPAYVPTMEFDVSTVRVSPPANSYTVGGYFTPHTTSIRLTHMDIQNLLALAYRVRRDQQVNVPAWPEGFEIQAKGDAAADQRLAALTDAQVDAEYQHLMQGLLADRFKLKTHWEMRQAPTYNLVVDKSGPKVQPANPASITAEERKNWGDLALPAIYQKNNHGNGYTFVAHGCTMKQLAETLADQMGHPVTDATSLPGRYDFQLVYYGTMANRKADDLDPVTPIEMSVQDQLGLKLEPAKGMSQFLVIDHIEKPSDN